MKYEPPALITGSTEARVAFDTSLAGILTARADALIVDSALVSRIHRKDHAQRVALIVNGVEDVRKIVQHLQIKVDDAQNEDKQDNATENGSQPTTNSEKGDNNLGDETPVETEDGADVVANLLRFRNRLLIAGQVASLEERCSIRLLALKLGGIGVILSDGCEAAARDKWSGTEELQQAKSVFDNVLAVWATGDDDRLHDTWGEPRWAQHADLIIPSGWDSEAKIRAVADAFNSPFDVISERGQFYPIADDHEDECVSNLNAKRLSEKADETPSPFVEWFKKHKQWMARLGQDQQKGTQKDDRNVPHTSASVPSKRRSDGDFFQRLLTSSQ